ncbi:DNRLRE domain-containing protein [Corallococcus sicarius]|uniref:DNRLRE domain-containing protein n=2 Tax=Corallococcus sicarius TaxID=2316726 RepID=A0A3A8NRZ8_9BACT|nr:DNRLRE domain-containing protein [Corallococcus sicarius]
MNGRTSLMNSPSLRMGWRVRVLLPVLLSVACGEAPSSPDSLGTEASALGPPVTVSFQEQVSPSAAYTGVSETSLLQSTPGVNTGADTTLRMDRDYPTSSGQVSNGLLRFDVSAIPANATVQSVRLTVFVKNATTGEGYFVHAAGRAWNEAQATWTNATSTTAWAAGGASGATDRGATSFATLLPGATGSYGVDLNAEGVAAVQGWVQNAGTNHGFVLDALTNMDGLELDSSESATLANRPKLTVTYALPTSSGGTGLLGQYFTGANFQTLTVERTDPTVNFDWTTNAPVSGVPADGFSVRWTGQVMPLYSQTYTFFTQSDDGVRLWVNGQQLVNNWTDHASVENSGTITLTANQKYDVRMEYYDSTGSSVVKLSWASASQPKQIIPVDQLFPAAAQEPGNPGLTGLDNTGKTIPDTNYAIPSGAIFLATNGNDSNAGTQAAPVATLNRAIALVPAGGTIVVRGGVYRDWYNNGAGNYRVATKVMTLQAYPHEQPWFDGTDVKPASAWTSDGAGHWYMDWSTPSFCNGGYYNFKYDAQPTTNTGPCSHFDMYGDPANPAAGDPQMVFIDGAYVHEVKTLAEATPGNFFYDWNNRRIYIATNPTGHTVEVAARPVALVLGVTGYTLKGLGFRRYATNEYSGTTSAAVYIGATNSLVENCVFTQMAAGSLSIKPQGGVVRRSVFASNGFTAIGSNGSTNSNPVVPDGLLLEENIVNANNTERFGTNCSRSCAQAGVKIAHMNGFTVRNNVFEHNLNGAGFWCDEDCRGGVMVGNISRNNKIGIFYEVSDTGIIASNLIYDNTYAGIQTCSSNTKIYNNTLVDNAAISIWIYDDSRNEQDRRGSDIGPDTVNVDVANNIMSGGNITTLKASRSDNNFTNTGPNTFFSELDYNSYYRSGGTGKSLVNWVDTGGVNYTSLAAVRVDRGWELHGHDLASGGDPFFVNQSLRNYVVRPSSVAYNSGKPLPADVAQAIGVPAGTVTSRGAITWPGR